MSSRAWQIKTVTLGRGEHDENTSNVGEPGVTSSINCDFGIHGAVQGRPCGVRETGFTTRGLDSSNNPTVTTGGSFGTKEALAVDRVRDGLGERPLLVTRGRAYTREDSQWTDRLGVHPLTVRRAASTFRPDDPAFPSGHQYALPVAPSFGPADLSGNFWLLSSTGELLERVHVATSNQDVGGVARAGTVEAYVYVENNTANLKMILHTIGASTLTAVTLATDAAGITGYGDAPCVCADFDTASFFVSYVTTAADNRLKVLKVDNTGTVTATATVVSGVGHPITGTWVTNSSVADYKVVLGWADGTNGYHTKVYSHALVDQAVDVLLSGVASPTGIQTQIVVGAAQNGACWYAISKLVAGNTVTEIGTRSLTAATSGFYKAWTSFSYTPAGGFAGGNSDQGASIYLQHQPVVYQGRVLIGLAAIRNWRGTAQAGPFEAQGATWYVYDVTDLHANSTSIGSLYDPVLAAHGPWEGSQAPWQCATAVIWAGSQNYSFQTVDWTDFAAKSVNSNTALGNGSTGVSRYSISVGLAGWDGLNVIGRCEPQVDRWGETTVIGGSAPRAIAGGYAHPLGFQFLGGPGVRATLQAGGAIAAGEYGWTVIWRWIDDRGQVHRSAPAPSLITVSGGTPSVPANSKITLTATPPILAEREGKVFADFYSTGQAPPATGAVYYLQGTVSVDTANVSTTSRDVSFQFSFVNTATEILYTVGGILENRPAEASGGVAVLGRRLWISDGHDLFASKFGTSGDAPAFNDQITSVVPPAAGRVNGLATVDGRVLALCSHGVFAVTGQGPDDTGSGPDFSDPARLSEIACAGQRAVVSTPRGVIFIADGAFGSGDPLAGGPWIAGRDGNFTALAARIQNTFDPTIPGNCAYLSERELFVWAQQGILITWDLRTDNWSLWQAGSGYADFPTFVGSSGGMLRGAGGTEPCVFSGGPGVGQDVDTAPRNVAMSVTTNNIPLAGDDRSGWARVRAMRVLGENSAAAHTLTVQAMTDDGLLPSANAAINWTQAGSTSWPTNRYDPEVRFTVGRASAVTVFLSASPATAIWSALQIQTRPSGAQSPAKFRA